LPGDSPREAVQAFLEPVRRAVSCVTPGVLVFSKNPGLGQITSATVEGGSPVRVASSHYDFLHLELTLNFKVIEDEDDRGPYRCTSLGYVLSLSDAKQAELVSFHWHPFSEVASDVGTHVHLGEAYVAQKNRLHIPTPRISVEEFLRLAIDSFGAHALVPEEVWRSALNDSQAVHEEHRTWHGRHDMPDVSARGLR
jgi:hypothetical protein